MNIILYIIGCPFFVLSIIAYIFIQLKIQPKGNPELDDCYYEFENLDPAYARYLKWSKIALTSAVIAVLMIFVAVIL